jgi:trans-2,3-dihydro-3-hydroxyanthranilate isomerase
MAALFVLCDVFAEQPFAGNPLAVFLDAGDVADDRMLAFAREFGWSEVTFVLPAAESGHPRVRIWTPRGELPFAGHPTVGTAVVLAAAGRIEPGHSLLELGIGLVGVDVALHDGESGTATMTQRSPQFGADVRDRAAIAMALGLGEDDLAPGLPVQVVSTGLNHLIVPLRSLDALGRARANHDLFPDAVKDLGVHWAYLFTTDTPGTIAAARTRLLAPGMEDAATGSAAGPLGAYLVRYGLHRSGAIEIEQGIEMGRPSRITVDVPMESGEIGPVRVTGSVRIWGRGTLHGMLEP